MRLDGELKVEEKQILKIKFRIFPSNGFMVSVINFHFLVLVSFIFPFLHLEQPHRRVGVITWTAGKVRFMKLSHSYLFREISIDIVLFDHT